MGFVEVIGGLIAACTFILCAIGLAIGIIILWTWCIWWTLTFFHLISMPYTWEFALAILILSSLFGGILRVNRR